MSTPHRQRHRTPRRRRATTIMELLVALPLAVLAAAAAAMLLVRLARTARAQSSALAGSRELRHARLVLTTDVEPIDGTDLRQVSDTLLEFRSQLGVLLVCASSGSTAIDVGVPAGSSDLWIPTLRAGDVVRVWRPAPHPAAPPSSALLPVAAPPVSIGLAACGADSTTSVRRWRISLLDSLPPLVIGPASAHRLVRYRHYRSGGEFWIGRQSEESGRWDGVQPVAGPLSSPAAGGLRVQAHDAAGLALTIDDTTPDSVRQRVAMLSIVLRTARRVRESWSAATDSTHIAIPLRASGYRRRP